MQGLHWSCTEKTWNCSKRFEKKSKGKLKDGKAVGGKGHRLSDKTIDKLQEYYGKAIRSNVNQNAKTKGNQSCNQEYAGCDLCCTLSIV